MASGDILSCTIRADGWSADVVVDGAGFAVGATYDFGSLGNSPATVDSPKFTMSVVSEGYSASGVLGTISRTVYGTHVVRKPYPNEASKDETDSGTTLSMRVALSECVYADDKNGGAGTSGTNPTVTIAAGWCVSGANSSNAATNLACTNNSTLAYPKVVAQWAWGHTPAWRRITADTSIGCIAYHGHGIACVALSATDAHAHSVSGTATAKTAHQMSASGLYYESYDLAVPVSSFTDGDDVTLRFIAYPLVGDASSIIDTSTDTTLDKAVSGATQITCTYKTTSTSKYVASTGNDTIGDGSTGNPYLTIGKALAQSPDIVYVKNGTFDILGSTPVSVTAKNYAIEIRPDSGANVTLDRSGTWTTFKASKLAYVGIQTIAYSSGNGWLQGDAATSLLMFDSCGFSQTTCPMVGLGYGSIGTWFINCTGMGADNYNQFGGSKIRYTFAGCDFTKGTVSSPNNGTIKPMYGFVANDLLPTSGQNIITQRVAGDAGSYIQDNLLIVNNRFGKQTTPTSPAFEIGTYDDISGLAVIGNIFETISGAAPALWLFADSSMKTINNAIVAHNTIAGERANLFYNDVGTTANVRTNIFCRNNAFNGFAIKTDTFGTQSGNRVGNWAQINGVNFSDNRFSGQPALGSFVQDYYGSNVKYETDAATFAQLGFTTDNSKYGAGTGNGNYLPTAGSVLKNHTLRQKYQSYDLDGVSL